MHADLIDQAERECLLHDGRAVQTDKLAALVLTDRQLACSGCRPRNFAAASSRRSSKLGQHRRGDRLAGRCALQHEQ